MEECETEAIQQKFGETIVGEIDEAVKNYKLKFKQNIG